MKRQPDLDKWSVEKLVELFITIALEQNKAMFDGNSVKFNRLFDQMEVVKRVFKSREGDQRRALLPLHYHRDVQVRFTAAVATRELAPEASRRVFQSISDRNEYPQAADARGMLAEMDRKQT
jgi:hypothetical protein